MSPIDSDIKVGSGGQLEPLQGKTPVVQSTSNVPFKDILKNLVDQVDSLQKEADASIEGLVTGETKNVHDVVLKLEEAGIAFELMMKVREKLLDAYQQVMRMQG